VIRRDLKASWIRRLRTARDPKTVRKARRVPFDTAGGAADAGRIAGYRRCIARPHGGAMRMWQTAAFILVSFTVGATDAGAQVLIKVNENVNFRLGALGQFQADWLEDPDGTDTQQNLFIRRVRLLFGGQVARNVTFFIETDAPNLGRTVAGAKNISPQVVIQDAYGELKLHNALLVDFGLMFVPFSRNSIQSAATLLPIDYGAYTFSTSAPTQSTVGRDTGVQARGYFLSNRLEYRIGAFQGARDARSHRPFRYTGRVQAELLDPEPAGFFYSGTYLGARKIAAVAAAFDAQEEYTAYDADAFVDYPVGPGAVTAQLAYHRIDGDTTFPTLPRQNVVLLELGYFLRELKLTPVFQFTNRGIVDTSAGDETRWSIGLNYWWAGHNANIKGAWGRIDPSGSAEQNQFTVQFQLFYF
jgi:phosphate-selective porin O/P